MSFSHFCKKSKWVIFNEQLTLRKQVRYEISIVNDENKTKLPDRGNIND